MTVKYDYYVHTGTLPESRGFTEWEFWRANDSSQSFIHKDRIQYGWGEIVMNKTIANLNSIRYKYLYLRVPKCLVQLIYGIPE